MARPLATGAELGSTVSNGSGTSAAAAMATGGPGPGVARSSIRRNYALVGAQTRGDKARYCVGLRVNMKQRHGLGPAQGKSTIQF